MALFSLLAVFGIAGCGGVTTCDLDFADVNSQELCDAQAAPFGCDIPAAWSAATQFCSGVNCTSGCPTTGSTD